MNRDKFLNPNGKKSKAYVRSPKQEKELAKRGEGRVVHRSGSGGFDKGDIRGYKGICTIEAKSTSCKSFSVSREMVDKLEDAATAKSEIPILLVEWLDSSGVVSGEVAVVPMWVLDSLLDNQNN